MGEIKMWKWERTGMAVKKVGCVTAERERQQNKVKGDSYYEYRIA